MKRRTGKRETPSRGQIALPFGEGFKVRRMPRYRKATVRKAGELQVLWREATEMRDLLRSGTRIIEWNSDIDRDPDVERGLHTIDAFLKKFDPDRGPGFNVNSELVERVGGALRLINAKWDHVLEDARVEISEKLSRGTPRLPLEKREKKD